MDKLKPFEERVQIADQLALHTAQENTSLTDIDSLILYGVLIAKHGLEKFRDEIDKKFREMSETMSWTAEAERAFDEYQELISTMYHYQAFIEEMLK